MRKYESEDESDDESVVSETGSNETVSESEDSDESCASDESEAQA
jgi:hypothetical protein